MVEERSGTGNSKLLQRNLLKMLEQVRSRFVVAITAETKTTPPVRWRVYIETERQMRQCLRELRSHAGECERPGWNRALDALERLPAPRDPDSRQGDASRLCVRIREILDALEQVNRGAA